MDREQRIAYVQAQTACLLAELEAAKAANQARRARGEADAYDEVVFRQLPEIYGLTHAQVVSFLQGDR